jgi:BirA family biotin operon repressor/biotin-[acetyl-CoA-carboxylase] ligase
MRCRITRLKKVDSTNDHAAALAERGITEGRVIVADYQTKGRGRFRREWVSAPGENLLFSIILRPKHAVNKFPILTLIAARAMKKTLEESLGLKCSIKRPNDILIRGKKVCGILTESSTKNGKLPYVILGIGLNVNSTRKTLVRGATSLRSETGTRFSHDIILANFLEHFKKQYDLFNKPYGE